MALQIRRGSEADRITFIPAQGELLYSTDDKKLYIGDGITPGGNAVGGGDLVTETTAAQFVHNQHTNISFTYNSVSGRIIGSVPGLFVAGDDSTVRTVNLGETIKFSGTGGSSVTSDVEGNITIDSLTYNIEAIPTGGGAKVRLQSALSQDDITFVGAGGATITAIDASTIEINASGGGGGVNSGLANQIAYYATSGSQVSGTVSLTWNETTQTLSTVLLDAESIITDNSNFAFINTNNSSISFGGTLNNVEYSGRISTVDLTFDPTTAIGHRFLSSHNSFFTNLATFIRQRGTLASPQKIVAGDIIGGTGFVGYDGSGYKGLGNIVMASATTPVTGSGIIPGIMIFQTANSSGNTANALWLNENQGAEFFGDVTVYKSISNNTLKIQNNVIESIVSNSNIELRTSGTGAIYLDNVSVNQGIIDTLDSSALQFTPSAVFASDVTVENDLTITNKVYANEFISTSTSTPEISATTQLLVTVGSQQWNLNADGGLKLPILSSAPGSPVIGMYVADGVGWDPDSKAGSVPYPVYYDGSAFNALY